MTRRRPPRARSFEWLSGRRASQMHGSEAAGTPAAAAEDVGAAVGAGEEECGVAVIVGLVDRSVREQQPTHARDVAPTSSLAQR